jgi:hypothetical protein
VYGHPLGRAKPKEHVLDLLGAARTQLPTGCKASSWPIPLPAPVTTTSATVVLSLPCLTRDGGGQKTAAGFRESISR